MTLSDQNKSSIPDFNWTHKEGAVATREAQRTSVLLDLISSKLGQHIAHSEISLSDLVVTIRRNESLDFFRLLKLDSQLSFDFLVDVTAIDNSNLYSEKDRLVGKIPLSAAERFTLVYHLMSYKFGYRIRVKIAVPENSPEINSVTELWNSANFAEREVYDMFGISFLGHPDLRRVLMYDEFKGHPLRKDYPVQGKQPRIKLRYPEVENTARSMQRPELIKISKKAV